MENVRDADWVQQECQRLRQCAPKIEWIARCWHYENVKRGDSYSKERVYTHKATMNYEFESWRDTSLELTGLDEWKLTKLKIWKKFVFANDSTKQDYESKWEEFKRNNKKDQHQEYSQIMVLGDWKDTEKKILIEAIPGTRDKYMSKQYFNLFSCLFCAACYRTWMTSNTGKKHVMIEKEICI